MKSTPEGHGGTIPGELGPAIERTKQWTPADEKRKRRELEQSKYCRGYRIWTSPDGKMNAEIDPSAPPP